ncbi:MAG TPA: serine/threonine protein phosphatase [Desulfobacteraceae bacterium]|nr:serine/threonine protein phosphatase [Desulfobacteraceae bacterium]
MSNERVLVIGDIHGCLDMLIRLMDKVDLRPDKDRLIFLGDYIDRGEDSKGVVDRILDLKKYSSQIECLMGNHEAMFLDYLSGINRGSFLYNGGTKTLESYIAGRSKKEEPLVPVDHLQFYKSLKLYIELQDYYIVHAGFRPGVDLMEQEQEDMIWIREPFIHSNYDFGKRVIFGHTPFHQPLVMDNKIGLDTGAVYGNKLTCLDLYKMEFYSVEA